jgi:hypothetical protein
MSITIRESLKVFLAGLATAFLCAPRASATIVSSYAVQDGASVRGVAITDCQYAMGGSHTAYATVTVTSPSVRTAANSAQQLNYVSVYAWLPIIPEDGTFTVTNYARVWCPYANAFILAQLTSGTPTQILPYIFLSSVAWSPASIGMHGGTGGTATLTVTVTRSPGCQMTKVDVAESIYPAPSDMMLDLPPSTKATPNFSGTYASQGFVVSTDANNLKTGSIHGDGMIPDGTYDCAPLSGKPMAIAASPDVTVHQ